MKVGLETPIFWGRTDACRVVIRCGTETGHCPLPRNFIFPACLFTSREKFSGYPDETATISRCRNTADCGPDRRQLAAVGIIVSLKPMLRESGSSAAASV